MSKDKLFVGRIGESMLVRTDDNNNQYLAHIPREIVVRNCFLAQTDGQVITYDEVVDYNAGDLVLIFGKYDKNKPDKLTIKVTTCHDLAAIADIMSFFYSNTSSADKE